MVMDILLKSRIVRGVREEVDRLEGRMAQAQEMMAAAVQVG